ncbi:protein SHQ1 homolog [Notolabrus celidotus]|uniref:protein SHQ1 homolog n=1 Tax=Notolabrus celidotus TaxID=1203425 RepID=UPI00148F51BC|nr:protein SHQ1 homolog [Notolabrus celidotus]
MLTPAFDLSQNPDYLTLNIRVPYTRTSEFDLDIDGSDFKFYAKPYFLRLSLPGRIVEDGREKAKFDIDKGLFTVQLPKETSGEHFEGLQMLTSLLAPNGSRSAKPFVEVLSSECSESAEKDDEDEEEEMNWHFEQEVYKESSEEKQKYGFGNQRTGVFARLQEELSHVIDVKNPEDTTAAERRQRRLQEEACAFSPDHYLADLFEDEEIKMLLKYKPWWEKLTPSKLEEETSISFTDDEKQQLRKFNNRSYLLDKTACCQVWLSLVDILLAYSYEVRSTEGEHNVESPWTIRKLSGTLCWLEMYSCIPEVLVSFGRRVLCYPLHRHFAMISAALSDTARILMQGKACVLRCLLHLHKVFSENDPAYILNDLYITDYCIWIQRVKSKKMTALATMLLNASLQKKDLELELVELEEAAAMVIEEEEDTQGVLESALIAHDDTRSCSSDSEDAEAKGKGCNKSNQGGGDSSKDSPVQPQPSAPIPKDLTSTVSKGSKQLIQELQEMVLEERTVPQGSSYRAERSGLSLNKAEEETEETTSGTTFLEISPRRNQLLVVQKQKHLDE